MPKIVSGSTVSTSENTRASSSLPVYYCLHCSEFLLILDRPLALSPRRKTDAARILDNSVRRYKANCVGPVTKLIKRADGYERQHRYSCPRCLLPFLYETESPNRRTDRYSYIIHGSLRDERGRDVDATDATVVNPHAHLSEEGREALMRAQAAMVSGAENEEIEVVSDDEEPEDLGNVRWRKEDLAGRETATFVVKNAAPAERQVTAESLLR